MAWLRISWRSAALWRAEVRQFKARKTIGKPWENGDFTGFLALETSDFYGDFDGVT